MSDSQMADPPFGTRTVRELDGTWSVIVDGQVVASGCSMSDAIKIEAIEIAALEQGSFV